MNNDYTEGCISALIIFIVTIGLSFIEAAIGNWLWSKIMVDIFRLPVLTYWQFFGLIWLAHIILPAGSTAARDILKRD